MTTRATRGPRRRTVVAMMMILAVLGAFVIRLVDIQVVNADQHIEDAVNVGQMGASQTIAGSRGEIVDTDGSMLASTVTVYDAQLSPKLIDSLEKAVKPPKVRWDEASTKIAAALGTDAEKLRADLAATLASNPESQYFELAKGLTTSKYLELRDLDLPYLFWETRDERVYPNGAVAGNLIGFLDSSGAAQAGVEAIENTCLAPKNGERTYLRGRTGVVIPGSESSTPAVNGGTVKLTINRDLQWYMQQMISEEAQTQGAKAGTVTVVEAATGKIRAAAEWPSMDPNNLDATSPDTWGTKIFGYGFEPGSTFKAVTAATVIDAGGLNPLSTQTVSARETFPNGAVINDPVPHPTVNYTLAGALIDSSNVALSKFGSSVAPETREEYLRKFGVGSKTIGMPGEQAGLLRPAGEWDSQSLYTTTFGQAFTVTAPQLAGAYQALANGGKKIDLSLVEGCTDAEGNVIDNPAPKTTQVVSEKAAAEVDRMLENVATQGELAEKVKIDGYRLGIKTGTAQVAKADGSGYVQGAYFTSMVGMAPMDDPQYVVVVTLDRPTRMVSSAATASAFHKAMTQVLKTYRVPPSTQPMEDLLPKFG